MPKITKKLVDAAQPSASEFTLWDSEFKGFGLRVRPSGAQSYVVVYRRAGEGRRAPVRRMTIGAAGKIAPDEARRAAKRILGSIAHGDDPAADRAQERRAATMKDLAESFLLEHVEAKRKPATAAKYRYVIEAFIVPEFGRTKPSDITRAAVARLHHENVERPTIANYIVAVLSAIFTFGEARGLIPDGTNPTRHVERYDEEKRERFLTGAELGRLGDALREAETKGLAWRGKVMTGPIKAPSENQESCLSLRPGCSGGCPPSGFHRLPTPRNSASEMGGSRLRARLALPRRFENRKKSNNGWLAVPVRRLADRINVSQATASRALRKLVTLGFLELVKSSSFSKKNRKASEYRLTHLPCDLTGNLPSKLFMHIGKASPAATHSFISGADSFMGETVD
jgi:uncharacterized membrane protein